jgi:alpha-amylase
VVVALPTPGPATIPVGSVFKEGERLRDAYTGQLVSVASGQVRLEAGRVVLLERAPAAAR